MKSQNTFSGIKIKNLFSRIFDGLILLMFILFFASAGFQDKNTSGWYQQFFPNMNGSSITSITFLDSLTGCAVTNTNSSLQSYILKTTNGGDNWNIVYTYTPVASSISFNKIAFADANTGFATVNYYPCFKTTNGGTNWFISGNSPSGASDLSVINKDTLFVVSSSGLDGGVFRSTNGGFNWTALGQVGGSGQPSRIYMYDKNLGFTMSSSYMRRTTNGGFNWTIIPNEAYQDIKLRDTLNGWKCNSDVRRTTDGGITWTIQQLPQNPEFIVNSVASLSIVPNSNTIWGVYGTRLVNNNIYGIIYKTTNGGINWGYQLTDTSIHIGHYDYIQFINNMNGWAIKNSTGIHTTTGGSDTTYITGISNNISVTPNDYKLYQNYPNPFNAISKIKYKISKSAEIRISVYDIIGKEVAILLNERKNPGEYSVSFNGNNLSSGIYFYTMYVNDVIIETKKMLMIK